VTHASTLQSSELHRSVPHAYQPTDDQADGFKHSPHFSISALAKRDVQPAIATRPATRLNGAEVGRPVIEHYTVGQRAKLRFAGRAEQANRVLPRDLVARMHQTVRELTVRR